LGHTREGARNNQLHVPTTTHTKIQRALPLNLTNTAKMLDVEDFETVFQIPTDDKGDDENQSSTLEYTDGLLQRINENQRDLGGRTFFERLLELLQIKCELYPRNPQPQTNS
jgi:hypothetical protein